MPARLSYPLLTASIFLFALVAFYSFYKLAESPRTWYDEGIYIQAAKSLAENGTQSIQVAPGEFRQVDFLTVGYPVLAPVAASMKLFGFSLFSARLPMVAFILLLSIAAWFLLRELFGTFDAVLGLSLLSTLPLLYGNGKNVLGEIPGLFFAVLALFVLIKLEKDQFTGVRWYLLLGLSAGLCAATKPVFLLVPLSIALVLLTHVRSIPLQWREIAVAVLSFTAPMLVWIYLHFGPEANIVSILQYYANPYGVASVTGTMAENLLRFFKETTPMYLGFLYGAWSLALCVRVYRKEKITLAEKSAYLFSLLVLIAYLRTAGWYRYFFETLIFALIFLPSSLYTLYSVLYAHFPSIKKLALMPAAIVILLSAMQLYQLNFTSWVAEHYKSPHVADMTAYFASYPTDQSIFIYNSPAAVIFLPTNNYYQYMQPTAAIGYGVDKLELIKSGVPYHVLLSQDQYDANPELFAGYEQSGTAASYIVLNRKQTGNQVSLTQ